MRANDAALDESYADRHISELSPVQQLGFYSQFLYRICFAWVVFLYARRYGIAEGLVPYEGVMLMMPGYVVFTAGLMFIARAPRFRRLVRDIQLAGDMFGIAFGLPHDPNQGLPLLSLVYIGFLDSALRYGVQIYLRQLWSVLLALAILVYIRYTHTAIGFSALDGWHIALFIAIVIYGLPVFAARDRTITALRETTDRLQLSLQAPGVYAWHSNDPMHQVRMEGNLKHFLGVDPDKFSDRMADYFARIHPDDRDRFSAEYRNFIKSRELDFECEYRLVREDGETLYVNARSKAHRDSKGRVLGISGMIWDLTEQRRQQEALRLMEERYRLTTQSASVGVWVWNALDRTSEVDESLHMLFDFPKRGDGINTRFKLTMDDFLRKVHPDDRARLTHELRALVKSHSTAYFFEYRIVRRDGEVRGVQSRGTVFRSSDGRAIELAGVTWDATQLMKARQALEQKTQELERTNKELDDFSYIASHDLKEPLRGISNYANYLQEDHAAQLDDKGREMLQKVREQAARMETLIQELLNVARIERARLQIEETDLQAVLQDILASLEFGIREKNVEIRISQPLPKWHCDRVRIGELFRNLITNGIKYNDKAAPWLEIGCQAQGQESIFYVRDNGIGIKPEHHEQVFTLFKRLHTRDAYGGGTGVGMTIAQKIVQMHDGRIWLESETGNGTTFYFTLGGTAVA